MAKKSRQSRRARRRQKGRKARPNIPGGPPPAAVAPAVPAREARLPREKEKVTASLATDFSEQYAYVRQDLKRIGLLAGTIFAALIALSFFLR